jgi:hypothetical protein
MLSSRGGMQGGNTAFRFISSQLMPCRMKHKHNNTDRNADCRAKSFKVEVRTPQSERPLVRLQYKDSEMKPSV